MLAVIIILLAISFAFAFFGGYTKETRLSFAFRWTSLIATAGCMSLIVIATFAKFHLFSAAIAALIVTVRAGILMAMVCLKYTANDEVPIWFEKYIFCELVGSVALSALLAMLQLFFNAIKTIMSLMA